MKLKSLLFGSAAAMIAATGAQAADAVIAIPEPEPVEYVRVCDAFGTGYFYIPGTETCIKFGGYIRYDADYGDFGLTDIFDVNGDGDTSETGWQKRARFQFNVTTKQDTELGELTTYAEIRFNYESYEGNHFGGTNLTAVGNQIFVSVDDETVSNEPIDVSYAWIQLGGLRIGHDESVFTTFTGYAGGVMHDDLISFGPFGVNLISYEFENNGFTAKIAFEDDSGGDRGYLPDIVGALGYDGGAWQARVVGAYDESVEEFAIKGRLDFEVSQFEAFVMGAWGSNDTGTDRYKRWNGDWAIWAGFSVDLTDKATFNFQGAVEEGIIGTNYNLVANVNYRVTPGFIVRPEIVFEDGDDFADSNVGGRIRFQRSW